MGSPVVQIIVLAGIAIFLIIKLRNVLGTRDGFENPHARTPEPSAESGRDFKVIDGALDRDIAKFVEWESDAARAFSQIKNSEPGFKVADFVDGARNAYEYIMEAFLCGNVGEVKELLSEDVFDSFQSTVSAREEDKNKFNARFVGIREVSISGVDFEPDNFDAEVTMEFVGELIFFIEDPDGNILEGDRDAVVRQKDVWTFAREVGSGDPNWKLVATGE